jgi:phosphoribosylformimino-5-aminoimidazole carboxamide ribotide isomerase
MKAIPAIDLRDGACVQLVGGRYAEERVRLPDAVAVARDWRMRGFDTLHLIDLDAATGRGSNTPLAARVIAAFGAGVQIGGGVRDERQIETWLGCGASRVVLGTRAIEEPEWLVAMAARFPHRLVVAADTRGDAVVTRGWSRVLPVTPGDLIARVAPLPLAALLVTAVEREGRLAGADLELYRRLAAVARQPLIASGGIATLEDLRALAASGVGAAVIGMALYLGTLDATRVAEDYAA